MIFYKRVFLQVVLNFMEVEEDGKISFLDIGISRTPDASLITPQHVQAGSLPILIAVIKQY